MHCLIYPTSIARHILRPLTLCLLTVIVAFAGEAPAQGLMEGEPSAYQERLQELLGAENQPAVIHFIDSLREQGHTGRELSWQYARALFLAGRLDMARDSLLMWEEDPDFRTRAESMLVQIAVQQRNHTDAIKYLIRLRDRYPENPVYPHRLARVFTSLNQLAAAEGQYALAYRLDTLNQPVMGEWADVLQKLGFTQRAYRTLRLGIAASPENLGFRRQMVALAYEMRKPEEAIGHTRYLLQLGDTTAQTVKLKAFSLFGLDSLDRAEYWIDHLMDAGMLGEDVLFYKGRILAARGEKDRAQEYFFDAARLCLSPNFNSFAMQAGVNLYETRQYTEAIRWLQMLRNFSHNPMITFYLALNYYEFYQDKGPALEHFRLFTEQSHREEEESHREFAFSKIREITGERHFRGE